MNRVLKAGLFVLALAPVARAWRRGRQARALRRAPTEPRLASWPAVSVIVPAWREQGTLIHCLDWLARVAYTGESEIIVVAGGDDGTLASAQAYATADSRSIQVLAQRSDGGKNGAMNDGAARAKGEILVFLDADTIVTPGWLDAMVEPLCHGYAASTGKFVPVRRTLISTASEMSQVLENEARGRVQLQGSGGMAVRKEIFEALGGIPEGGAFADDWDLSERLLAAGHQIAFAPTALSCSERPACLAEWWRNELRWRRIHLTSLQRVADIELAEPLSAAKALYPYATAWLGLLLTAAALGSRLRRGRLAAAIQLLWLALVPPAISRELAGAVETAAYTGQGHWLRMLIVLPVLTLMGWAAGVLASLSAHEAQVHYKGPRQARSAGGSPKVDGAPHTSMLSVRAHEVVQ